MRFTHNIGCTCTTLKVSVVNIKCCESRHGIGIVKLNPCKKKVYSMSPLVALLMKCDYIYNVPIRPNKRRTKFDCIFFKHCLQINLVMHHKEIALHNVQRILNLISLFKE